MQSAVNKTGQLHSLLDGFTGSLILFAYQIRGIVRISTSSAFLAMNHFFLNRPTKCGEGVVLLVRNAYSCHVLSEHCFSDTNIEKLTVNSGHLAFCVVYRPPHGNLGKFFHRFERE